MTRWMTVLALVISCSLTLEARAGQLSSEQRGDFLTAAQRISDLRLQVRRFGQVAQRQGLGHEEAQRYQSELRDAFRQAHRQHDRFALSLDEQLQDDGGPHLRRIERFRTKIRRRLGQLDELVQGDDLNLAKIQNRADSIACSLQRWSRQYKRLSAWYQEPM
ncbi:MAG: hypothetical protein AAF533_07095 [Acidobacteriota bacterium]